MDGGPNAGRREIDPAWIGLGVGNEFWDRFDRNTWIDFHHIGRAHNAGDGGNVPDEIEIEVVVKRYADRIIRRDQEERVAVRSCAHDRLGADSAATTGPVLDDEWLAEPLRQPLSDQARHDVGAARGSICDNDAYRPCRICLSPR